MSGASPSTNANNDFGLVLPKNLGGFNNHYSWNAGTNPNGATVAMAPVRGTTIVIMGRMEAIETGAAAVNVVVVRPGLTVAQGRIITSIPLNAGVGATILQPQYLAVPGVFLPGGVAINNQFAAGDLFALVATGTFSASQGLVQIIWVER